ncbi:PAS domain S-box protein [Candidatus Daviesbacteria bacterium]|nr:PAS domain S-box protein [Candidatus Daviesbacteria bacterium]
MNHPLDYLPALKILPEAVVITDTNPDIVYINPAFERLTGYKLAEVKGKNPRILKSGQTPLRVYRALYQALMSGKPFTTKEVINKRKDGSLYQINASYIPIEKNGKPVFYVQIQHDITEYTEAETELAKRASQLVTLNRSLQEEFVKEKALLESIGDGVIAMDKKGEIIALNNKTEAIFGWKTQDVLGKSLFAEFKLADEHGKIIPKALRPIQLALTTAQVGHGIYFLIRKGVEKLPLFITSAPVILDGTVVGAVNIYRNVSQQVAIDRAKDEFLYFASHTLRTPLSAVAWSLERLNEEGQKYSAEQKKFLDRIYEQTQRMIQLTNDLLDATRMEFGILSYKYEEVNPLKIASDVIEDLENRIKDKKIKFKLISGRDIKAYQTYSNAIYMIMHNLLSNAVKFTPAGGTVSLKISRTEKELILQISDSGVGIPKGAQERIFQKMYRAHNVKDKFEGSGLGLYITSGIINHMGGKITVKSSIKQGTVFTVILPVALEIIQSKQVARIIL